MKKYFIILIFSLFSFSSSSFAYDYNYKLENLPSDLEKNTEKINNYQLNIFTKTPENDSVIKIIKNFIKDDSFFKKNINQITIDIWTYNNGTLSSFSNIHNKCHVSINYPNIHKKFFLDDKNKDIFMVLAHELSHCVLGEQNTSNISWKISLSSYNKDLLKERILFLENNNKLSPFITYHETFADTLATLILYKKKILNIDDLNKIIDIRKKNFENEKQSPYLGYLGVLKIKNLIENDKINIQNISDKEIIYLATIISQSIFIEYLSNQ